MYLDGISLKALIRREGEISKNSWYVKTTSGLQKVIIKKKNNVSSNVSSLQETCMERSSVQQCKDTPHTPGQVKSYKGCPEATSATKKLFSVPKNKSKGYETN